MVVFKNIKKTLSFRQQQIVCRRPQTIFRVFCTIKYFFWSGLLL
uniref:ASFV_G_ACD_01960 n=1 Tax=African swine fever virus TaxID=10497 RepID=A0A8A8SGH7_ASF|nr:ASFV_G_ACD_01960 [African swine fever virus]